MPSPVAVPAAPVAALVIDTRHAGFLGTSGASVMLEAMPGPAMVVNQDRQILAVNQLLANMLQVEDMMALLGVRPGETLRCLNFEQAPDGCGSGEACSGCGALRAMREVLASHGRAKHEFRLSTSGFPEGRCLDLRVHASYLAIDGEEYVVMALEDLASEKRRQVLERAFFHDLLNTCGGVQGLAELLLEMNGEPEAEVEYKRDLVQLSRLVVDEIQAHRQMLAAEKGELVPEWTDVDVRDLLQDLVALYRHHIVSGDRDVRLGATPACRVRTDVRLLRRVLGNLIKNALEATPAGVVVDLCAEVGDGTVTIEVHNAGVIPRPIQVQIFQRSFSTKGGEGRGIGTYAVRLFTEHYLGGRVSFVSDEAVGTIFRVTLPSVRPA